MHRVEQYLIINSSKAITFAHHVTWVTKSTSDISCMPVEEDPMTECPTMDLVIKESGTDVVLYDRGCKTQIGGNTMFCVDLYSLQCAADDILHLISLLTM